MLLLDTTVRNVENRLGSQAGPLMRKPGGPEGNAKPVRGLSGRFSCLPAFLIPDAGQNSSLLSDVSAVIRAPTKVRRMAPMLQLQPARERSFG